LKLETVIIIIVIIIIGYSFLSNIQQMHSVWNKLEMAFDEPAVKVDYNEAQANENIESPTYSSDEQILENFYCPIRGEWLVTSNFGRRKIFGKYEFHKGIDLISKDNDNIYAAFNGILIYKGRKGGYGNTVIIKHSDNLTTLYAHLRSFTPGISKDDKIEQHQKLGKMGNTGRTNGGKHLHFEIRQNGKPINPRPFLKNW